MIAYEKAKPIRRIPWRTMKVGAHSFVPASERSANSVRVAASLEGRIMKRKFSVRKCRRGDVDGVRVERVA